MTRHDQHDWHLELLEGHQHEAPSAQAQRRALKQLRIARMNQQAHRARVRLIALSSLLVLTISLAAIAGI